jgi:hypothetical protein
MANAKRTPPGDLTREQLRTEAAANRAQLEAKLEAEREAMRAAHLEREEARRVERNARQALVLRDDVYACFNGYDVAFYKRTQDESDRRIPDIPPTTTWDENYGPGTLYIRCGLTVGLKICIADDTIRAAVQRLAGKIFGVSPVVIKGGDYHFGRNTTMLYRAEGEPIASQGEGFGAWNCLPIEVIGTGRMIAISDTSQHFYARQIQYEGLAPYAVPRIHCVPGERTVAVTPIPPPGSAHWSDLPTISEAKLAEFMAAVPGVTPPGLHVARARNLPRPDEYTPPVTLADVADILRADGGIPIDGHSTPRYVHGIGAQVWAATGGEGFALWAAWFVRAGKAHEGWGAGFDKFPRDQMERSWNGMKEQADKIGVMSLFHEAGLRGCKPSTALAGDSGLPFYDPDTDTGPAVPWLVQGLIGQGTHGLIVGAPGHGKSFLAVDIGHHVALGWPWQGRAVTQGPVLYIACEGGPSIMRRMAAFCKAHGIAAKDVPFRLIPVTVNLADESGGADLVIAAIRRAEKRYGQPVALVFIDTVAASLGTCEENGAGMLAYVANVQKIISQTGVTVQSIHHPSKAGGGMEPRGHSSLKGAADASLVVRETAGGRRSIFVDKLRDGERGEVIDFHIERVDIGDDTNGVTVTSGVVRAGKAPGVAKVRGHGQPEGEKVKAMTAGGRGALARLASTPEAINHGVPADMVADGARVVAVADWLAAAISAAMEADPTTKAESVSRSHRRAVKGLLDSGTVVSYGSFVWAA